MRGFTKWERIIFTSNSHRSTFCGEGGTVHVMEEISATFLTAVIADVLCL